MLITFLFIAAIAAVLTGLMLLFKSKRKVILIIASFVPIALVAARIVYRICVPGGLSGSLHLANVLQGLPLQMCGIASILLPVAALTKNRLVFDITYFFSMPGALLALLLDSTASLSFADFEMWAFFVPHVLYFVLPIIMTAFGYITPRIKDIPWVMLIIAGIITVVHLINLLINHFTEPMTVNFIFTLFPGDSVAETGEFVELPLLGQLYHFAGETPYFYLFLFLPVLAALDAILALPFVSKATYKRIFSRKRKAAAEGEAEDKDGSA